MNKKILTIVLTLFVVLIVMKHYVPKPVEWDLSFSGIHKKPYGCSVVRQLLSDIFPEKRIENNQATFYLTLNKQQVSMQNLIIVCDRFSPDELDLDALFEYVAQGNSVFISSLRFPEAMCDTLGLKTNEPVIDTSFFKKITEQLLLHYIPGQDSSRYRFIKRMPEHYFNAYDSLKSVLLGSDRLGRPNFIYTRFGKGNIYLHCQPLAFTNFHMLYGNYQYACTALSLLPVGNTIWDQYYKPNKVIDSSPVRYILSNPPLRSAWYVILTALTIYLIFGSRRMQRAIPVMRLPENASLNFIRSIGKLYFKSQNHADLAKKKVDFFKDFLKNRYNMKSPLNTTEQIQILKEKSGVESKIIEEVVARIAETDTKVRMDKKDLYELHQVIEQFYKNCK